MMSPTVAKSSQASKNIIVDISRLSSGRPEEVKNTYDPEFLDLKTPDIKFSGSLNIDFLLERISDRVIINGSVFMPFLLTCSRCLKEYKFDLTCKASFDYQIENKDTIIDLTEDLRSEIILNYPPNPLCRDDCKGLCIICGEDLNQGKCKCDL